MKLNQTAPSQSPSPSALKWLFYPVNILSSFLFPVPPPQNNDTESLAKITGYPKEEIEKGLWPAVEEFLENNSNWKLYKKFTHNNGLTILKKDEHY